MASPIRRSLEEWDWQQLTSTSYDQSGATRVLTRHKKLQLFHALIVSKLQYGLSTLWLITPQRRRLNGLCARCLRRIHGIPAAFISRVSNAAIFARAGVNSLTDQILRRQPSLLGRCARAESDNPLRRDVFLPGSLIFVIGQRTRRIGRPRQDWASEVWKVGARLLGQQRLRHLMTEAPKKFETYLDTLFKVK